MLEKIKSFIEGLPYHTELSIALIKNSKTEFYGIVMEGKEPRDIDNSDSAFDIGSVTKVFTSNLLAKLITENEVGLDDDIQSFLSFGLLNSPKISLLNLANHTSGLPALPQDFYQYEGYNKGNPYRHYDEQKLTSYLATKLELAAAPGEKFIYSNLGAGLLSYLISEVEKKPFEKIAEDKIFKLLQMNNTSFNREQVKTILVPGIDVNGSTVPPWEGGILKGATGMISTARDLAAFFITAFDETNRAFNLQSTETFVVNPDLSVGLGLGILKTKKGNTLYRHNGGTKGYSSSVLFAKMEKKAIIVLSNISPYRAGYKTEDLAMALMSEIITGEVI